MPLLTQAIAVALVGRVRLQSDRDDPVVVAGRGEDRVAELLPVMSVYPFHQSNWVSPTVMAWAAGAKATNRSRHCRSSDAAPTWANPTRRIPDRRPTYSWSDAPSGAGRYFDLGHQGERGWR